MCTCTYCEDIYIQTLSKDEIQIIALRHLAKVLGNMELGPGVLLDVLNRDIRCELCECQLALLPVHFEHTLVLKSANSQPWLGVSRAHLPNP